MPILAKSVEMNQEGIIVEWNDGHTSAYPHRALRLDCPCAHCVDEWTHRRILDPISVPEDVQALDWMQVGNYALQFMWSDTHYTGIYPFKLLREMCPCPDCALAREEQGKKANT